MDERIAEKLFAKLEVLGDQIHSLDKKFEVHAARVDDALTSIHQEDQKQNQLLEEHSSRCTALEQQNKLSEQKLRQELYDFDSGMEIRLFVLEEARTFRKKVWRGFLSVIGSLTAICGLLYVIFELVGKK